MPVTILATKLHIPLARQNLVPRPRLTAMIERGILGPLTLISASAGFGKTTLVSEWRAGIGHDKRVAWLSLDAADNDPLRFFAYLALSIEAVSPGALRPHLDLLQSFQIAALDLTISSLIETLNSFTDDMVIILEDYHVISNLVIHEALSNILNHLPPPLHLVILSRADPPLPLARLRVRNQLTEIRASDLRFTLDEVSAFLMKTMGLSLSAQNVASLEARTEGWVAGLQLAALSMQSGKDMDGFIRTFTGSNRYVLDYLAEEVLQQQSDTVRTFLLHTSILERLTGSLCDAVTGQNNGEQMLVELERRNLFIVPLDTEQQWYRYHHLLADLLFMRFKQEQKTVLNEAYLRASEWCAQQGLLDEAIRYAVAARNYQKAAELIEINAWDWLNQGNVSDVLNWIAALPEEQINIRPKLGVVQAWAFFVSGQEDRVALRLQTIEKSITNQTSGEEILLRAINARWHGENQKSFDLIEQAVGLLDESQFLLHSQVWFNRGMLYKETHITKAQLAFRRSSTICKSQNNIQGALNALYFEGTMFRLHGELHRSAAVFRQALELAGARPFHNFVGYIHLGMAELTYEWNDLGETAQHLEEALRLSLAEKLEELHFMVVIALARLHRIRSEWLEAQQMLDQAEQLAYLAIQSAQMRAHSFLTIPVLQEQVCLWLAKGNMDQTLGVLESLSPDENLPLLYQQMQQAMQARIFIAHHKNTEALNLLNMALKRAKDAQMAAPTIGLLRAAAYFADGNVEQAIKDVGSVLALAEQEGHVRAFLDEGGMMTNLLRHTASKGLYPSCIRRLLAATAAADQGIKTAQPLIEPLSARELEILRLVEAGKSNLEIANALVLSIGTVKKHVSNIFQKLNVDSRTRCIAIARELNLLG